MHFPRKIDSEGFKGLASSWFQFLKERLPLTKTRRADPRYGLKKIGKSKFLETSKASFNSPKAEFLCLGERIQAVMFAKIVKQLQARSAPFSFRKVESKMSQTQIS